MPMMPLPVVSFHLSDGGLICFFNMVLPMDIFLIPRRVVLLWTVHPWHLLKRYLALSIYKLLPVIGGFLGDVSARSSFVQDRVDCWVSDVFHLSQMAVPQPQAAYIMWH